MSKIDTGATGGGGTVTHTGALTANAVVLGNGTDDIKVLGSLGTTTTILHGNAAGAPTFAAVSLTADVTGVLPAANGGSFNNLINYQKLGSSINSTGTTPVVLATTSLPARAAGEGVRIDGLVFHTQASGSTTLELNFAGTVSPLNSSVATEYITFSIFIMNDPGSTSAQQVSGVSGHGVSSFGAVGATAPAQDWTSAKTVSIQSKNSGASTTDAFIVSQFVVTKIGG